MSSNVVDHHVRARTIEQYDATPFAKHHRQLSKAADALPGGLPARLPLCELRRTDGPPAEDPWWHRQEEATAPGKCDRSSGAFVTLLSGPKYLAAARCLHAQMRTVGSSCRLALLYDDREVAADEALTAAYGRDNLIPLSRLIRALPDEEPLGAQWTAMLNKRTTARGVGRRLYAGHTERSVNFLKFWLWALPRGEFDTVVYIDTDVIINRNIDHMLRFPFVEPLAAVSAVTCGQDRCVFNAGVFVLRPELSVARALLRQRAGQYCEHQITDQSLLNLYFVGRWKSMPVRYNSGPGLVSPRHRTANESQLLSSAAIWHMWGEPKPWANGGAHAAPFSTTIVNNISLSSPSGPAGLGAHPEASAGGNGRGTRARGHDVKALRREWPSARRWHEVCGGVA